MLQFGTDVRSATALPKRACQDHLRTRGKRLGSDCLILITCCETLGGYLALSGVVGAEAAWSRKPECGCASVRAIGRGTGRRNAPKRSRKAHAASLCFLNYLQGLCKPAFITVEDISVTAGGQQESRPVCEICNTFFIYFNQKCAPLQLS